MSDYSGGLERMDDEDSPQILPSGADESESDQEVVKFGKRARSDSPYSPEERELTVPALKKRKPRKLHKAKLESLSALPLDLLEDICHHLDLETLFCLSRANKQLHRFLVNTKSKPLWNAAREMTGLPKLTSSIINDLTYARLLYGSGCDLCGAAKHRTHRVDFEARIRHCRDCAGRYWVPDDWRYVRADVNAIESWLAAKAAEQKEARAALRDQRRNEIEKRFSDLGWSASHFQTAMWIGHALFKPCTVLNDRSWKHAQPILKAVLEAQKVEIDLQDEKAARDKRLATVKQLYASLREKPSVARAADLFPLPVYTEFIELESVKNLYEPSHADNNLEVLPYDAIIDDLDATKAVLRLELFNLLRAVFFSSDDPGPAPNEDGDFTAAQMKPIFDRIDALFTCPKCSTADYYPELLAHTCRSSCASFSTGIYQYSSVYAQYARDLLNTIDPQPENGVESLGNCFSCKTCTPSLGNTCRTWIQMLRHLGHYSGRYPPSQIRKCTIHYHKSREEVVSRLMKLSAGCESSY